MKNIKRASLNQCSEYSAPKHWLKYTTHYNYRLNHSVGWTKSMSGEKLNSWKLSFFKFFFHKKLVTTIDTENIRTGGWVQKITYLLLISINKSFDVYCFLSKSHAVKFCLFYQKFLKNLIARKRLVNASFMYSVEMLCGVVMVKKWKVLVGIQKM